jgi:malate dehydrogenase (quinone)
VVSVLEKCFAGELRASVWLPKLKEIVPSYGVSLFEEDAELCKKARSADTAEVANIENIDPHAVAHGATTKARKSFLATSIENSC